MGALFAPRIACVWGRDDHEVNPVRGVRIFVEAFSMRIGLIVGPWFPVPPERYGGTERVVDALARALSDAGHDVLLAAASDSTCPVPLLRGFGPSLKSWG